MSSYIDIIIRGINQANNVFKQLDGDSKLTAKSLLGLAKAAGVATLAYEGFDILKDIVGDTVEYAKTVDDMSRALGTSTEEASKLIQVADDLRIDTRQLQVAFRFALNKGIDPSIDGLKSLAVEYQGIQDPIEKAQFAMENFGTRGGLEMQKVLELTSEELDAMAKSAEEAGLVLSGDAVDAAQEFYDATDALSDMVEGLKITIGTGLIPVLTDAAEAVSEFISESREAENRERMLESALAAGIITRSEYVKIMRSMTLGTEDLNRINVIAGDTELALRDDRRESIAAMEDATGAAAALQLAEEELAAAEEFAKGVLDMAIEAVKASNVGMAEKLRLTEELELAAGELTTEEILLKDAIGFLTKMLDDGKLTEEEYIELVNQLAVDGSLAAEIVKGLGNAILLLPDSKDIHINVKYHKYGDEPGPDVPVIVPPEDYVPGPDNGLPSMLLDAGIGPWPPPVGIPPGNLRWPTKFLRGSPGRKYIGAYPGGTSNDLTENQELKDMLRRMMEFFEGGAVNQYNLTINEAGNRGNVVMDFEIMKALARA